MAFQRACQPAIGRALVVERSTASVCRQISIYSYHATSDVRFVCCFPLSCAGSLYYFSFCTAKRLALRYTAAAEAKAAAAASTSRPITAAAAVGESIFTLSSSSLISAAAAAAGDEQLLAADLRYTVAVDEVAAGRSDGTHHHQQQQQQHQAHHLPHGPSVDYHHDTVLAVICSDERDAKKAAAAAAAAAGTAGTAGTAGPSVHHHSSLPQQQQDSSLHAASSSNSSNNSSETSSSSLSLSLSAAPAAAVAVGGDDTSSISHGGRLRANMMAAVAAALVGAAIEAPMELFKHRLQAGQITGSMLGAMAQAFKSGGPRALYWGFLPFLYKSLPYDMGELVSYSSMQDWRDRVLQEAPKKGEGSKVVAAAAVADGGSSSSTKQQQEEGAFRSFLEAVPEHAWDMAAGAAAGAAAVLISMPTDCIKTVMETGGGVAVAGKGGAGATTAAFIATGRQLVARHGVQGLFAGLAPRLMEQVPSTMLYWAAVGGCKRLLQPYTVEGAAVAAAAAGAASSAPVPAAAAAGAGGGGGRSGEEAAPVVAAAAVAATRPVVQPAVQAGDVSEKGVVAGAAAAVAEGGLGLVGAAAAAGTAAAAAAAVAAAGRVPVVGEKGKQKKGRMSLAKGSSSKGRPAGGSGGSSSRNGVGVAGQQLRFVA